MLSLAENRKDASKLRYLIATFSTTAPILLKHSSTRAPFKEILQTGQELFPGFETAFHRNAHLLSSLILVANRLNDETKCQEIAGHFVKLSEKVGGFATLQATIDLIQDKGSNFTYDEMEAYARLTSLINIYQTNNESVLVNAPQIKQQIQETNPAMAKYILEGQIRVMKGMNPGIALGLEDLMQKCQLV